MYDPTKPYKTAIKELIRKTWKDNPYLDVRDGYYVEFIKKHSGAEVDHTDGIGTKGVVHWNRRTLKEAAQDVLAMNVNDLVLCGAKPYKAQVHLMLPQDDHRAIEEIMIHLSDLCADRKIAITGGETSIHSNLTGMEISLMVSGVVTEKWLTPRLAQHGDRLVCIPSSGVHSNGFTLIGELYGVFNEQEFMPWMTTPTRLYDHLVLGRKLPVHAAMHITGGAWSKLAEILPNYGTAHLDEWTIPEPFLDIFRRYEMYYDAGVAAREARPVETMYRTFNMGVGMVLAVPAEDASWVATAVGGFVGGEVFVGPPASSFVKQVVLSTKLREEDVVFR